MNIDYVDNKKIMITKETYKFDTDWYSKNGSIYEMESLELFYNFVNNYIKNTNNDKINIIDIGAHTGIYTLYSKFLNNSNYYSFEPQIKAHDNLKDNILLNNISNVNLFNYGLSDKKCNGILKVPGGDKGLATLALNPLRMEKNPNTYDIFLDTIDNCFFDKNINVDFIKIDTEGHEYFILKGGNKTINKYKPLIQLEFNYLNLKQFNLTQKNVEDYLKSIDYILINKCKEEHIFSHKNKKHLYFNN
tara:strand:- start:86 stop:826 length:741 start_codon:yes stop_codon:yes gene_type:complete